MAVFVDKEQAMIFHFDQLLRDYDGTFGVANPTLDTWRLLGGLSIARQMVHYVLSAVLLVYLALALYFSWRGWEMFTVAMVLFGGTVMHWAYTLVSFKNSERGRRTGPGLVRKYHIPLADAVERTRGMLREGKVPFTVHDVILTDRPDRPRASIFEMERSGVLLTLWKEMDDPYFTIAHLGQYTMKRERAVDTLRSMLDGHIPGP